MAVDSNQSQRCQQVDDEPRFRNPDESPMYKNIIVPIDLGRAKQGKSMLNKAKALADKDAKVTVVNVVEVVPGFMTAGLPDGLVEKASSDARTTLTDMVKSSGLDASVEIRGGRPHRAIVALADGIGADLVIIASHDPGIQDYFLGSTASAVVSRAKCSVLVDR